MFRAKSLQTSRHIFEKKLSLASPEQGNPNPQVNFLRIFKET
jgi:hypothetical protein